VLDNYFSSPFGSTFLFILKPWASGETGRGWAYYIIWTWNFFSKNSSIVLSESLFRSSSIFRFQNNHFECQ
jgi:hypothetical protein